MVEYEKLVQRVEYLEKRMDKFESKIDQMDTKLDGVLQFQSKIEVMFGHLSETLTKVELKIDRFIDKYEIKEDAARKEVDQDQKAEITKWKSVSYELAKWVLILLGGSTIADKLGFLDTIKDLFQ